MWQHVVGTVQYSSGRLRLYVDGELVANGFGANNQALGANGGLVLGQGRTL